MSRFLHKSDNVESFVAMTKVKYDSNSVTFILIEMTLSTMAHYSETSLKRTPSRPRKVSAVRRCPLYKCATFFSKE